VVGVGAWSCATSRTRAGRRAHRGATQVPRHGPAFRARGPAATLTATRSPSGTDPREPPHPARPARVRRTKQGPHGLSTLFSEFRLSDFISARSIRGWILGDVDAEPAHRPDPRLAARVDRACTHTLIRHDLMHADDGHPH
jgi:hypothetical protein